MRVLVTRPKEDAEVTVAKLQSRGHSALIAPLMDIRFRDGPAMAFDNVQAVLATSSNGVHALARRTARRDIPLFAVGAQTAQAARDMGFKIVRSADGNAHMLAARTAEWAKPGAGVLLHAAGAETKGELAETLTRGGYDVRTHVLYEAVAVPELPPVCRSALETNALDAALYYSPRSARIFADLVVKAALVEPCRELAAYCISQPTAAALASLSWKAINIAARPDQDALLALLPASQEGGQQ
jgi:uroporphyrinogen-III synthase